jgi:hypothetical protein
MRVVQITRDGRPSEDRIQLGHECGDTTMCPSHGTLARIVKDAVVGIEASKSLDSP